MSLYDLVARLIVAICFFLAMPLLGGGLLYKGMQRWEKAEIPLGRCIQAFFAAAASSYLVVIVCSVFLPRFGPVVGVLLPALMVSVLELLALALLLRQFTSRSLLILLAAVLVTNVVGYGIVMALTFSSPG